MSEDLFNLEAEALTLAAMLRYPDDYYSINDVGLIDRDFIGGEQKKVMRAISAVVSEKKLPDFPLVLEEIRVSGSDSTQEYLSNLLSVPCSIAQAHEYARTVKGLSASRALAAAGAKIIEVAREKRSDYESAISAAESLLHNARLVGPTEERSPYPADILERMRSAGATTGIPIQFSPTLQRVSGGMVPGHFWVVGGFSSVGKSAFAVNMTTSAMKAHKWVSLISIEMTTEQYMTRLLSALSGVPQHSIRDRITLPLDNSERLERAERTVASGQILIYDTVWKLDQIRNKAIRQKEQHGLDLLIVDFIQNVVVKGDEVEDARLVALELQRLAKELSCTVVGFSQVSNQQAQRDAEGGDRNYYSFKGHGAIRDAADLSIMLRRDRIGSSRTLNVDVVKNRHGELANIDCDFTLETGKITEKIYEEYESE